MEWDPFADPADEHNNVATSEECRPQASGQEAGYVAVSEQGKPQAPGKEGGYFMELLIMEGIHQGSWVACQVLAASGVQDTFTVHIPKQPPLITADVTQSGVIKKLLRRPLSPASSAILSEYYPVPRQTLVPSREQVSCFGWYDNKPTVKGRKLRVLVLHGTSSNAKIMNQQITPLRVACQGAIEFIYTEGTIDASTIGTNPQYELMSKYFPGQPLYQFVNYAQGNGYDYSDLEAGMDTLQKFMRENAPIDGVLGTGQGSNIGTLLAAQAVCGLGMPLSFTVHHGGTPPSWTWRFPNLFDEPLRIPSLHVTGLQDPFLKGHACHAELYVNPEIETHNEDHRPYPRDRAECKVLVGKVLSFMQKAAGISE